MENEIKELIKKWKRQRYMFNQAWKNACEEIIKDLESLLKFKQENCCGNMVIPEDKSLIFAFVQGAKWWEYHKTKFTMWQSDTILAEEEAVRRLENNTLGKTVEDVINENAKDKTETK